VTLNNRLLESQAVFGHAKPPKVDVQLSGVSSLHRRAFYLSEGDLSAALS
ncbi:UNVERIFIED_ORG: hypothetical protein M2312_005166, partial [Rhizobium esperanzae]|nr:hypothetical protein [Rhizobium esperanzae]